MRIGYYIGIIIVIIATVMVAYGSSTITSKVYGIANDLLIYNNTTVSSNSIYSLAINVNDSHMLFAAGALGRMNFYLFNSTGYRSFESIRGSNRSESLISIARSLEGHGTIEIFYDSENASFPVLTPIKPYYTVKAYNETNSSIPNSIYYLVADNTEDSASFGTNVNLTVVRLPNINKNDTSLYNKLTNLSEEILYNGIEIVIGAILLLIGIAVILYTFIKGRENKKNDIQKGENDSRTRRFGIGRGKMSDEQIDELYGIRKGKRPAKRKIKKG